MRRALSTLLVIFAWCTMLSAGASGPKHHPLDEHTRQEFDWILYLDVRDVPNYLDYRGSRLHPLTRVRVYLKRGLAVQAAETTPQAYEDFWYYEGKVIGMRRRYELKLGQDESGAVAVGHCNDDQYSRRAACNAVVRIFVSLLLKQTPPAAVIVPETQFDAFASELGHYHFSPAMPETDGVQTSIHLQSYPGAKDEVYYYSR